MSGFSNQERIVIFAFYYLDKQDKIDWFTKQFNSFFKTDLSVQSIQYEVAKLKNNDPSNNNANSTLEPQYSDIWREYVGKEKVRDLRAIYNCFKRSENENFAASVSTIDYMVTVEYLDEPRKRPAQFEVLRNEFERNPDTAKLALRLVHYACELSCSNELFRRRDGENSYVEAHHLIPLSYQNQFEYSLDVEANIISLCPSCHRMLHYGANAEKYLTELYNERIERLKKCKIEITLDQLLEMYNL